MRKLHLACGPKLKKGFINVDAGNFGQEVVADLNQKWAFASNGSVDYILIEDGLEHMESVEHFLLECDRVLKKGGLVEIGVPHYKCPSAYRLTHKHYFSWSYWAFFPEPHDITTSLVVKSNRLIVFSDKGLVSMLNKIANLSPKWWERFLYASGIKIILEKR